MVARALRASRSPCRHLALRIAAHIALSFTVHFFRAFA